MISDVTLVAAILILSHEAARALEAPVPIAWCILVVSLAARYFHWY